MRRLAPHLSQAPLPAARALTLNTSIVLRGYFPRLSSFGAGATRAAGTSTAAVGEPHLETLVQRNVLGSKDATELASILAQIRDADVSGTLDSAIISACARHVRSDQARARELGAAAAQRWLQRAPTPASRGRRSAAFVFQDLAIIFREATPLVLSVCELCLRQARDIDAADAAACLHATAIINLRDDAIIRPLVAACVSRALALNPRFASQCMWAAFRLGVCDEAVIRPLAAACVQHKSSACDPHYAASNLFSAVTLGIRDSATLHALAATCAANTPRVPRDAASSFWAAATAGLDDTTILWRLAAVCIRYASTFSASDAVSSLLAAAMLRVCDAAIVSPLAAACVAQTREFSAQEAATALWSAAVLGIHDDSVSRPLAAACVELAPKLSPQEALNCLWAAACLGISDVNVYRSIAVALPAGDALPGNVVEAQQILQCLEAMRALPFSPPLFDAGACERCWGLVARLQAPALSPAQREIASMLKELGYAVEEEGRVLGGLCTVDALVTVDERRVAIEFDRPSSFLRQLDPAEKDHEVRLAGPTQLRNRLLTNAGIAVVSVPAAEWRELTSASDRSAYLAMKLNAFGKPNPAQQQQLGSFARLSASGHALLNSLLRANDIDALERVVAANASGFNGVYDAALVTSCARVARGGSLMRAQRLGAEAVTRWLQRDPSSVGRSCRHAVPVLCSMAKLFNEASPLVLQVCRECVALAASFDAQEAAVCLNTLASLRISDDAMVLPVASTCARHAAAFRASDALVSLLAAAKLNIQDRAIVVPLATACARSAGDLSTKRASECLLAAACLEVSDVTIYRAIATAIGTAAINFVDARNILMCMESTRRLLSDAAPLFDAPIVEHCRNIIATEKRNSPHNSAARRSLLSALGTLSLTFESVSSVVDGLINVDALVVRSGRRLAIVLTQPSHFLQLSGPAAAARQIPPLDGLSRLQNRLLTDAGYNVVVIPTSEWLAFSGADAQRAYLAERLEEFCGDLTTTAQLSSAAAGTAAKDSSPAQRSTSLSHLITILQEADNIGALERVAAAHTASFNGTHLSTLVSACARVSGGGDLVRAQRLGAEAAQRWLQNDRASAGRGSSNAATVLRGLSKLFHEATPLLRKVCLECVNVASSFSTHDAYSCLRVVSVLGIRDDAIIRPLAAACAALALKFNSQEAVRSLWTAVSLGIREDAVIHPLAAACVKLAPEFNPKEAANSLWAVAKLGIRDDTIARPLAAACVTLAQKFNSQDAANSLWAVAKLGIRDSAVTRPLAAACVKLAPEFNSQEAANSLWAAAALGIRDDAIVIPLAAACVRNTPTFNAQDASSCLLSVATLGVRDSTVVKSLTAACLKLAPTFSAWCASNCLVALAKLGIHDDSITTPLAAACAARASQFDSLVAASCFWAVAKLGIGDDAIIRPLAAACVRLAPHFNAQSAANALWSAAKLRICDEKIISPLSSACVKRAPEYNAQGAASSLLAAATLGFRDNTIVQPLVAACVSNARSMTPQGAVNCLWAAACLELPTASFYRAMAAALPATATPQNGVAAQQILQCLEATRSLHFSPPLFDASVVSRCREQRDRAHAAEPLVPSQDQREVASMLKELGYAVEEEGRVLGGLCTVDALVSVGERRVAVEFDGPTHVLRWLDPAEAARHKRELRLAGPTHLRNRLLTNAGIAVVSVPVSEWRELLAASDRKAYLAAKLKAVGV